MELVRQQTPRAVPVRSWNLADYSGFGSGLSSIFDRFDRLFGELTVPFGTYGGVQSWTGSFPVDIYETDQHLVVDMILPGVSAEQLDIGIEGNEVTLRGTIPESAGEDRRYYLRTIPTGEFRRSLTLPVPVQADNVQAQLSHGILHLVLPKVPEAQTKKIAVKAN